MVVVWYVYLQQNLKRVKTKGKKKSLKNKKCDGQEHDPDTMVEYCLLWLLCGMFICNRIKKGRRPKGRKNVTLKLQGVGKVGTNES
jgi:hypothetical protein